MSHLSAVPSDPEGLRAWLIQRREADADLGFEWRNPEVELPPAPDEPSALTVHVVLRDTDPAVWRRLVVPGDLTLDRLHDVLQAAIGWHDAHLHRFFSSTSARAPYFVTPAHLAEGETGTPEQQVRLDQLLRAVGDSVLYEYDLGDSWDHELRLEEVGAAGADDRSRCTGGAGACPPEDVGGVGGYAEVAGWVRDGRRPDEVPPRFESHEHADSWLPRDWDPDAFDLAEADCRLAGLVVRTEVLERLRPDALEAVRRLSPRAQARISTWASAAAQLSLSESEVVELTTPYRILLDAVGDGVQLTASGYLPTDVVRRLWPALGIDPILAGKSNREHNIRPLFMFRVAVERARLLRRSGRRLAPTKEAARVRADAHQLWRFLLQALPYRAFAANAESGWFALLAIAGGVARSEVFGEVHALCVDAGWQEEDDRPITRHGVSEMIWPTLAALVGARWNSHEPWPSWVPAAAAALVLAEP